MQKEIEFIKEMVENGELCPFKALSQLDAINKALTDALESVKMHAANHFEDNINGNEKTVKLYGYEFRRTSSTTYTYSHFEGWEKSKAQLKSIETMMQNATKHGMKSFIHPETAEEYPAAIAKIGKSSISITKF